MSAGEEPTMPREISNATSSSLELAHVLFMDIVGYSLLLVDEQRQVIQRLQNLVRQAPGFDHAVAKNELICLPTGDGVALACFGDPTMAVRFACQVALAMKEGSDFRFGMGI